MKYISVLILIIALSWTWCLSTAERAFSLEDYKRVEAGVEDDINAFIRRQFPTTQEIYCNKLYSEVVQPGEELNVHFRCRAKMTIKNGDMVEQSFAGLLHLKSDDEFMTWSEVGGEIASPSVRFEKGTEISGKRSHEAGEQAE